MQTFDPAPLSTYAISEVGSPDTKCLRTPLITVNVSPGFARRSNRQDVDPNETDKLAEIGGSRGRRV